jgi:hypothetical protein
MTSTTESPVSSLRDRGFFLGVGFESPVPANVRQESEEKQSEIQKML